MVKMIRCFVTFVRVLIASAGEHRLFLSHLPLCKLWTKEIENTQPNMHVLCCMLTMLVMYSNEDLWILCSRVCVVMLCVRVCLPFA